MMTDEEKKAIDNFKKLDFFEYDWQFRDDNFETREEMLAYAEKMQKIILNLIERQQKEIEELKEKNKNLIFQLKDEEKELIEVTQNIISKDKIKKLYEEYKDCGYYEVEQVLKELLEED